MKAVVILSICLSVVSCHVLTKRSLLGGDPNGHAHGHKHQEHAKGQVHGEQQSNGQRVSGRRGREEADQAPEGYLPPSDDYQEDSLGGNQGQGQCGDSDSEYDYEYDDQQGQYGERGQYGEQGQYGEKGHYDDEGSGEGAQKHYGESQDYTDYYDEEPLPTGNNVEEEQSETTDNVDEGNPAVESYGAPAGDATKDIDSSSSDSVENNDQYNSPILDEASEDSVENDNQYSSPVQDAANSDSVENIDQYSSPTSDEAYTSFSASNGRQGSNPPRKNNQGPTINDSIPPNEAVVKYRSPSNSHNSLFQRRNRNKPGPSSQTSFQRFNPYRNGFPFQSIAGRPAGGNNSEQECPGGSIEECVKVCPGTTLRVYGACVNGCAERCSR